MTELQMKLDHQKEIKHKFLIETYKMFFPSYSRNRFELFNPNEALRNIYEIAQQMSNENFKAREIQKILEENDPEQKMLLILEIMKKTLDWKNIYKNI